MGRMSYDGNHTERKTGFLTDAHQRRCLSAAAEAQTWRRRVEREASNGQFRVAVFALVRTDNQATESLTQDSEKPDWTEGLVGSALWDFSEPWKCWCALWLSPSGRDGQNFPGSAGSSVLLARSTPSEAVLGNAGLADTTFLNTSWHS